MSKKKKIRLDNKTCRRIKKMTMPQSSDGNVVASLTNEASSSSGKTSAFWTTDSLTVNPTGITISANTISSATIGGKLTSVSVQGEPKTLSPIEGELFVSRYPYWKNTHHLLVMDKLLPDVDYTSVRRREQSSMSDNQLVFFSEEDRNKAEAWLDDYLEKFNGNTDMLIPPPIDGQYSHTWRITNVDGTILMEQWIWALQNCLGEIRQLGEFWFFADEGDATLFKLNFG